MLVDVVELHIRAGKGGDGLVHFRQEKNIPKGGPDGGDGGKGGNVMVIVDANAHTLANFRAKNRIVAESGAPGGRSRQTGKAGSDTILAVPPGTIIKNAENDEVIVDTVDLEPPETAVIAAAGAGGFGNAHFTSSVRRVPRFRELGEPGEERHLILELKLIADVGLVGLPNAGKSTLLSVVSNARPKIASYPFTTLEPMLGVATAKGLEFVAADIPGLIEGAAGGKGLGDEFLRHIERTRLLLHLISAENDDPAKAYEVITAELASFRAELAARPTILVITKSDLISQKDLGKQVSKLKKTALKQKNIYATVAISAPTKRGLDELLAKVAETLSAIRSEVREPDEEEETAHWTVADFPKYVQIEKRGGGYYLTGKEVEKRFVRTDFENRQSVQRLYRILGRGGVLAELRKLGAKPGDKIFAAGRELPYEEPTKLSRRRK